MLLVFHDCILNLNPPRERERWRQVFWSQCQHNKCRQQDGDKWRYQVRGNNISNNKGKIARAENHSSILIHSQWFLYSIFLNFHFSVHFYSKYEFPSYSLVTGLTNLSFVCVVLLWTKNFPLKISLNIAKF